MNVSLGTRWESFVTEMVRHGRYGSASEVVREGLRLVEEREAMLDASIAAGGDVPDDELDRLLQAKADQLVREGF